jgi:hypothetical protein
MRKAVWQVLGLFVVTTMLALLAGCGGSGSGGGAHGLSIELSGLPSTINPGESVSGTVKLSASSDALNGIRVKIKTTSPFLTGSAYKTDANGEAAFILFASGSSVNTKSVRVWAELDGVKSKDQLEISLASPVNNFVFNLNLPDNVEREREVVIGSPASIEGVVFSGNYLEFKDKGGEILSNPPVVRLSIDRIDNYIFGDMVVVNGVEFTGDTPTNFVDFTPNNTDNIANIPLNISILMLPASSVAGETTENTFAVYWKATATYNGVEYVRNAVTIVNSKTKSKAP